MQGLLVHTSKVILPGSASHHVSGAQHASRDLHGPVGGWVFLPLPKMQMQYLGACPLHCMMMMQQIPNTFTY